MFGYHLLDGLCWSDAITNIFYKFLDVFACLTWLIIPDENVRTKNRLAKGNLWKQILIITRVYTTPACFLFFTALESSEISSIIRVKFTVNVIMGSLKMINLVVIDDQWVLIISHTVIPKKRQAVWYFRKCKTINWKTTRNWLSNGGDTRETSVTTNIPENESIQFTLGANHQLLDEADHDVKNCTNRGYCYPSAKLDKSPQALHTSSHFRMIVLLS